MFKTILVPLSDTEADDVALEAAFVAARYTHAQINALWVRPDARRYVSMATAGGMGMPVLTPQLLGAVEAEDLAQAKVLHHAFEKFCKRHNVNTTSTPSEAQSVTATWCEAAGDPVEEITREAQLADMVVLGRTDRCSSLSLSDTGNILVGSGRPVLIAPPIPATNFAQTIAIAWKPTAEAARAIAMTMPLLCKAKKVFIVSAVERGSAPTAAKSAEALARSLSRHGIAPEILHVSPDGNDVTETVLYAAKNAGADLLLTGGYGHSRARELILGGFTRSVLESALLPVLMVH